MSMQAMHPDPGGYMQAHRLHMSAVGPVQADAPCEGRLYA